MNCPICDKDSKVFNSRPHESNGAVWRRRECLACKHRWTTFEVSERAFKRIQRIEQVFTELAEEE